MHDPHDRSRGQLTWEDAADALEAALAPVITDAAAHAASHSGSSTRTRCGSTSASSTRSRDVIDLARRLDIGVCVETNACWAERGLGATIADGVDTFRIVQVSDFAIGTLSTPNRLVPGDGDIPLERILGQVLEAGYEGCFDLELIGPRIDEEGYEAACTRSVSALGDSCSRGSAPDRHVNPWQAREPVRAVVPRALRGGSHGDRRALELGRPPPRTSPGRPRRRRRTDEELHDPRGASGRVVVASTSRCSTNPDLPCRAAQGRPDEPPSQPALGLVLHVELPHDDRAPGATDEAWPVGREVRGDVRHAQLVEHAHRRSVVVDLAAIGTSTGKRLDVEEHAEALGAQRVDTRRRSRLALVTWRRPRVTPVLLLPRDWSPRRSLPLAPQLTPAMSPWRDDDHKKLPPSTMKVWPVR